MGIMSIAMRALLLSFVCVVSLRAGCVSFAGPAGRSQCLEESGELIWENPASTRTVAEIADSAYDRILSDPSFRSGVSVSGEARFRLKRPGKHIVEVFLQSPDRRLPVTLVREDGSVADRHEDTYWRRQISLVGMIAGGELFRVSTEAAKYVLIAVRWTPVERFEAVTVPQLRERARRLHANPFLDGPKPRPDAHLEQLYRRLALSRNEAARREGVLGLARVAYWRLAEAMQPNDARHLTALLRQARETAPGDEVLRATISAACQGLNQPAMPGAISGELDCTGVQGMPWTVYVPAAPPGAPAWAVAQRRMKARMEAITRWWVEERMQPDGQLGGGWGDDCEILRSWGPLSLGLGSEVAGRGLRKVADGIWLHSGLLNGYARNISDAEHSAEDTADTQPLLAALMPDEPAIVARLRETSECAGNWITRQPDGRWRFKGSWFNCREVDPKPERAVDVHYNVRAMGPAMWYAYLSRDPAMIGLLKRWAESWLEAMRSTRHGKPAGIFPPVVNSADGSYLVRSDRWDRPSAEWDYYFWSGSSQEALTSLQLAVFDLTGERRWLDAAGESFAILGNCAAAPPLCEAIVKSPQAFYTWRRLSGDGRYDARLPRSAERGPAAILDEMEKEAQRIEHRLAFNFRMFTSEALVTDRIGYGLTPAYAERLFGGDAPRGERYPTMAVTWPESKAEFARAVVEAGPNKLRLRLYSFEDKQAIARLHVWRLKPGRYHWTSPAAQGHIEISRPAQEIELPLPPLKEQDITIEPAR